MAKWSADSGILRKKPPEKHEELLVFGYACKLFRDDEKAQYIDQGKHLIPWMGDEKLKIDRYDCRGALSELSACEASREGYDATRWLGLSESERKIEQLCDEERYYSLHTNEEEEELYKEEELKRLHQKSNEFQYSYDVSQKGPPTEGPQTKQEYVETAEEPFVPPVELDVPADIAIPKTVKENTRIEKTALFVHRQGTQMEILIKAKQANNPQFGFLYQDNELYKYYRHLLAAIKGGRYKTQTECIQEENQEQTTEKEATEDSYLHPSLLTTSISSAVPAPPLPTVPYRPTADCAYSQLVNRIQGTQGEQAGSTKQDGSQNAAQMTYEQQQQYYQYYYTAQYYEYYKQMMQYQSQNAGETGTDNQQGTTGQENSSQNQYMNFAQFAYAQYTQQHQQQQQTTSNPYAQIVSNLNKDNPYASLMENIQQNSSPNSSVTDIAKAPIIYGQNDAQPTTSTSKDTETTVAPNVSTSSTITTKPSIESVKKPLLSLAQYGSDSDDESSSDSDEVVVKTPPNEMQIVIDKMANYVSKNGGDFEKKVQSKGDPRFEFLNDSHEYHAYYRKKLNEYRGLDAEKIKDGRSSDSKPSEREQNGIQEKPKVKKIIAPVSFSIKKPKDDPPKEIKSALPLEESSEDEETDAQTPKPSVALPVPPPMTVIPSSSSISTATTTTAVLPAVVTTPSVEGEIVPVITKVPVEESDASQREDEEVRNGGLDADDPILEMIDLTDDMEERKDARRAEDRIKDKIAAAAREKMASVSRDRALQIERRKKAAAFLKLKSAETSTPEKSKLPEDFKEPSTSKESRKRSSNEDLCEKHEKRRKPKEGDTTTAHADSEPEDGEVRKHRSKKRKGHKRKHGKSKQDGRSHKKSKKRHRRALSESSQSSRSS